PETGLPKVRSREDYEALTIDDRQRFNRARRPAVTTFVDARIDLIAPADFQGRPGDIATQRYAFEAGPAFRVTDELDFAIRFAAEWSNYDFSGATGVIPGVTDPDPFDDSRIFSITPVVNSVNPDSWSWTAGLTIETAGESGADFSETVSLGGLVIASYPITSKLRIGGGITAQQSIARDDIAVVPIPIFDWRITDTVRVRTARRGLAFAYQPSFAWEYALTVTFERREFRLDDRGPIPGGAVIDRTFPVHFAVTYKPHPRFNFSGRIGSNVWSEMDVYTDGGARITDVERSAALSGGIELRIRF
ncbi:MAG: hypothetical protein AAF235_06475, partial [Planctomycetota bacterium]